MPNETLIQIGEPILFLTHPSSRSSWNITLLSSSTLLLCCASMVRCAVCGVRRGARLMCGSCITSTKTKGWRTCRDVRRTCRTRCLDSRASQAAPHAGSHYYWLCDILARAPCAPTTMAIVMRFYTTLSATFAMSVDYFLSEKYANFSSNSCQFYERLRIRISRSHLSNPHFLTNFKLLR